MGTLRLVSLKGLDPETKLRIRKALCEEQNKKPDNDKVPSGNDLAASKWHNVRTTLDGISFASKREAEQYTELKLQLLAGEISELELQKRFSLDVNGIHICDYVADFVYRRMSELVVEDVKSAATITHIYKIKKKLMLALHSIRIREVF